MKSLIIGLISAGLALSALAGDALQFHNPWVREAPPAVKVLAAFMTIANPTDQARELIKAESVDFDSVELHATVAEGGVMRMVQQEKMTIPANGQLELKPGSFHIMLINAKRILTAGDEVKLTLHFQDGSQETVTAPVRKMEGMAGGEHQHHMH